MTPGSDGSGTVPLNRVNTGVPTMGGEIPDEPGGGDEGPGPRHLGHLPQVPKYTNILI